MRETLLRVTGLVQGVGFRPFVWRLAGELGLTGWVRNDAEGVTIRLNGSVPDVFLLRLRVEAPPLARVDGIHEIPMLASEPPCPCSGFQILDSQVGAVRTAIGPDAALCRDCLREISTPGDRRWRYALTTCTHCGPRYTVSRGVPYDRSRTSLDAFPLCIPCAQEYGNPANRRFHAETTCCPNCGPQLSVLGATGKALVGDPIALTLAALRAGKVVAIKGIGGFHLACDARQALAVAALRERKQREAKPLAVMGLNIASLRHWVRLTADDEAHLQSPAAPIVVCPKENADLPDNLAPGLNRLGVMLPTSPLHTLIWHEAAGQPAWRDDADNWADQPSDFCLVMTSANPQGEPLVRDNAEALARLSGIADLFLLHDRDIVIRCDDSVQLSESLGGTLLRRARGYTPLPIVLPPMSETAPDVLAVGADMKNSLCALKGQQAFLSQYIGTLDNAATVQFHTETTRHLLEILALNPALRVHDRHPDFLSSRLALEAGQSTLAVGHHHAHLAAICAEHGLTGPALGLALDGVGLGEDGTAWGGELLFVDGAKATRLGHLSPLPLPGGDRAAREPWRMALAALHQADRGEQAAEWAAHHVPEMAVQPVLKMLGKGVNCPVTTSLGRWFDAAAGLLGVCTHQHYEAQAAMQLEALAEQALADQRQIGIPPGAYAIDNGVLNLLPLVPYLSRLGMDHEGKMQGAALFHAVLAEGLAEWAARAAGQVGVQQVLIGGGCALNSVLVQGLRTALTHRGLTLLTARQVPPNDSGLALGQAWIARQMWLDRQVSGQQD